MKFSMQCRFFGRRFPSGAFWIFMFVSGSCRKTKTAPLRAFCPCFTDVSAIPCFAANAVPVNFFGS
jgi:hypothetical protein